MRLTFEILRGRAPGSPPHLNKRGVLNLRPMRVLLAHWLFVIGYWHDVFLQGSAIWCKVVQRAQERQQNGREPVIERKEAENNSESGVRET